MMSHVTALTPESSAVRRSALAEPVETPPARWVAFLVLASLGLWAGFFGPIQVLLAQQAEAISPEHKKEILSLVLGLGLGAFTSVVCNRCSVPSRTGRRCGWGGGCHGSPAARSAARSR
jgi:hypothetical protein